MPTVEDVKLLTARISTSTYLDDRLDSLEQLLRISDIMPDEVGIYSLDALLQSMKCDESPLPLRILVNVLSGKMRRELTEIILKDPTNLKYLINIVKSEKWIDDVSVLMSVMIQATNVDSYGRTSFSKIDKSQKCGGLKMYDALLNDDDICIVIYNLIKNGMYAVPMVLLHDNEVLSSSVAHLGVFGIDAPVEIFELLLKDNTMNQRMFLEMKWSDSFLLSLYFVLLDKKNENLKAIQIRLFEAATGLRIDQLNFPEESTILEKSTEETESAWTVNVVDDSSLAFKTESVTKNGTILDYRKFIENLSDDFIVAVSWNNEKIIEILTKCFNSGNLPVSKEKLRMFEEMVKFNEVESSDYIVMCMNNIVWDRKYNVSNEINVENTYESFSFLVFCIIVGCPLPPGDLLIAIGDPSIAIHVRALSALYLKLYISEKASRIGDESLKFLLRALRKWIDRCLWLPEMIGEILVEKCSDLIMKCVKLRYNEKTCK